MGLGALGVRLLENNSTEGFEHFGLAWRLIPLILWLWGNLQMDSSPGAHSGVVLCESELY